MTHHLPPTTIYAADMGALTLLLSSWMGYLPIVSAVLAGLWYAIMIYDRLLGK